MHEREIIIKVKIAIDMLFSNDYWLLANDLNEKSITHKLAEYLQQLFIIYNVDCEYNGNIDNTENGRKRISILKEDLERHNLLKIKEIMDTDAELADRQVFPDIIIHRRGTNEHNLCIIEVKKSTSNVSSTYDEIKLQAYTINSFGNDLRYRIGIFIEFSTGQAEIAYDMKFFINGRMIDEK